MQLQESKRRHAVGKSKPGLEHYLGLGTQSCPLPSIGWTMMTEDECWDRRQHAMMSW